LKGEKSCSRNTKTIHTKTIHTKTIHTKTIHTKTIHTKTIHTEGRIMLKKVLFGLGAAVASVALLATVAEAQIVTEPTGLGPGVQYRLVFKTSTLSTAASTDIADYNAFVTGVATGVPALNALGTTWKAMASTATVDARDNVDSAMFVPIYRLDDTKIFEDGPDIWDGSGAWGDQPLVPLNVDETGAAAGGYAWNGSFQDGTARNTGGGDVAGPLGGAPGLHPGVGDAGAVNWTWLGQASGNGSANPWYGTGHSFPLYAISDVLITSGTAAPTPITTVPTGLSPGDTYRLAFRTSASSQAVSTDIAYYNAFADGMANTIAELRDLNTTWQAMASTATVDARDNVDSLPGVPIYRVDDTKIFEDGPDIWDGGGAWGDQPLVPLNVDEAGATAGGYAWNGSFQDGTARNTGGGDVAGPLGGAPGLNPGVGDAGAVNWTWLGQASGNGSANPWYGTGHSFPLYVVSGSITVPIPEPGSFVLLLCGGLVAGLIWRKRQ
jgi:hypothetical protein